MIFAQSIVGSQCLGDGSCDHLDDQSISLPSEIVLKSGLFEVRVQS